jgi:hypothetical protein
MRNGTKTPGKQKDSAIVVATARWASVAIIAPLRVKKGDLLPVRLIDTGHARKTAPCAGYLVTDREDNEIFIPDFLMPKGQGQRTP